MAQRINYVDKNNYSAIGSQERTWFATDAMMLKSVINSHADDLENLFTNKADLINGKLDPNQVPDLAINDFIFATEETLFEFTSNYSNYTYQKGDIIVITDTDDTVHHYFFLGGDKSLEDNYSELTSNPLGVNMLQGYSESGTRLLGNVIVTLGHNETPGEDNRFIVDQTTGQSIIHSETSFETFINSTRQILINSSGVTLFNGLSIVSSSYSALIKSDNLTEDREYQLPDEEGELALKSDISGLVSVTEINGVGYRLFGRNPDNYGEIGYNAIDFSESDSISSIYGATGDYSIAQGYQVEASGNYSIALGNSTEADGMYSVSIGNDNISSSYSSITIGENNTSNNSFATSIGINNINSGYSSLVFGNNNQSTNVKGNSFTVGKNNYNNGIGSSVLGIGLHSDSYSTVVIGQANEEYAGNLLSTNNPNDPLFIIGNGTINSVTHQVTSRSNALQINYDGTLYLPSYGSGNITQQGQVNRLLGVDIGGRVVEEELSNLLGVMSVTGDGVDNTDPQNPIIDLSNYLTSDLIGQPNGLPPLNSNGVIPDQYIPKIALSEIEVVPDEASMLSLNAQKGDIAVRTDISTTFILRDNDPTILSNWVELLFPPNPDLVQSVNGEVGHVSLLLSFSNGELSITGGNSIDLDNRYSLLGHTHSASDITSGQFADSLISQSSVLQYESQITITENQISDLGSYLEDAPIDGNFYGRKDGVWSNLIFDNYQNWKLHTNNTFRENINSSDVLNIIAGDDIEILHSAGGNITINNTFTETPHDNVLIDEDFTSNGIMVRTSSGVYDTIVDNSLNWNTAYGWGDHSLVGYALSTDLDNYLLNTTDTLTGSLSVTEDIIYNGELHSISNNPLYLLRNTGGLLDEKDTLIGSSPTDFYIGFRNDANTITKKVIRLLRTGADIEEIQLLGSLKLGGYGAGSEVGTATYILGVDSNGNVIEEPLPTQDEESGIIWEVISTNTHNSEFEHGYVVNNNSTRVQFELPTTNDVKPIRIVGKGSAGWQVNVPSGWTIHFAGVTATTNLQSSNSSDSIELLGVGDNEYQVISSMGSIIFN